MSTDAVRKVQKSVKLMKSKFTIYLILITFDLMEF